jgi:hypothetical protein
MSLVTYPNSNKSRSSGRASRKATKRPATPAGSDIAPTFFHRLRNALAATGWLIVNVYEAIGEARLQKAMIEAELYRNRYMHTSKNDDDLPIVR